MINEKVAGILGAAIGKAIVAELEKRGYLERAVNHVSIIGQRGERNNTIRQNGTDRTAGGVDTTG